MEIMGTGLSRVAPRLPAVGEDGLCVCLVEREVVSLDLLGTEKQPECLMRPRALQDTSKHLCRCHACCLPITACLVQKSCTRSFQLFLSLL